jgi:hypothetical protein
MGIRRLAVMRGCRSASSGFFQNIPRPSGVPFRFDILTLTATILESDHPQTMDGHAVVCILATILSA